MDSSPEAGTVEDDVLPTPTYASQFILPLGMTARTSFKVKDGRQYLGWKETECGWFRSDEFVYFGSLGGNGSTYVPELFKEPSRLFLQ